MTVPSDAWLAEMSKLERESDACFLRYLTQEQRDSLDAAGADAVEDSIDPDLPTKSQSDACKRLYRIRGRCSQAAEVSRSELRGDSRSAILLLLDGFFWRMRILQDEVFRWHEGGRERAQGGSTAY